MSRKEQKKYMRIFQLECLKCFWIRFSNSERERGWKSMFEMYFLFDDDSKHIIIIYDSSGEIALEGKKRSKKHRQKTR